MKKIINVVIAVCFIVSLGACSMSWDTVKYAKDTKKIAEVGECFVSLDEPVIPEKATKIRILEPVMFDWDDATIRPDQEEVIEKVAALMAEYPDTIIVLEGSASVEGTEDYNYELSQARADSVLAALVAEGVESSRIINAMGMGETDAFGDEFPPNRRVMVLSID
jgi:outer membrane protein OmpA-like peptidoglycan-associated protein